MAVETKRVEEVLREGGFTSFHRKVVAITGFAWTFVAFEIILIGFVLPAIFETFGIDQNVQPVLYFLVASATLMGSFIGSLVLGRLADARGRRMVFLVSILWYSVFTALTAVSWGPWGCGGGPRGVACPFRRSRPPRVHRFPRSRNNPREPVLLRPPREARGRGEGPRAHRGETRGPCAPFPS